MLGDFTGLGWSEALLRCCYCVNERAVLMRGWLTVDREKRYGDSYRDSWYMYKVKF